MIFTIVSHVIITVIFFHSSLVVWVRLWVHGPHLCSYPAFLPDAKSCWLNCPACCCYCITLEYKGQRKRKKEGGVVGDGSGGGKKERRQINKGGKYNRVSSMLVLIASYTKLLTGGGGSGVPSLHSSIWLTNQSRIKPNHLNCTILYIIR